MSQKPIISSTYRAISILFLTFIFSIPSFSQGRSYIKQMIREWGECRNVAITKTNGDLALYSTNGTAQSGLPDGLSKALTELNNDRQYIDDVQLTENGRWMILYGNNGIRWNDIPYSLEQKLRDYNKRNEVINSVTFNDAGDWIVITDEFYSSSSSEITQWLKEGESAHGELWAACITDDAMVAVYAKGYKFYGNVPDSLRTALKNTSLDVYRLKIAGTAWFFADKNGGYNYNM
ncbi:MAG: hypothetical protein BGO30_08620 [Bacteroidetes bacterium 41-46]|nr:MAG: hypothetical protein BGO30_08620 [Bacteroidetes bacterium 41-46]